MATPFHTLTAQLKRTLSLHYNMWIWGKQRLPTPAARFGLSDCTSENVFESPLTCICELHPPQQLTTPHHGAPRKANVTRYAPLQ